MTNIVFIHISHLCQGNHPERKTCYRTMDRTINRTTWNNKRMKCFMKFVDVMFRFSLFYAGDEETSEQSQRMSSKLYSDNFEQLTDVIRDCYANDLNGEHLPLAYTYIQGHENDGKNKHEPSLLKQRLADSHQFGLYFGGDRNDIMPYSYNVVKLLLMILPKSVNLISRMLNALIIQVDCSLKQEPSLLLNKQYKSRVATRLLDIYDACRYAEKLQGKELHEYVSIIFGQHNFPNIQPLSWILMPEVRDSRCISSNLWEDYQIEDWKKGNHIIYIKIVSCMTGIDEGLIRKPVKQCICCRSISTRMRKCGRCHASICSTECLENSWSIHKASCKASIRP